MRNGGQLSSRPPSLQSRDRVLPRFQDDKPIGIPDVDAPEECGWQQPVDVDFGDPSARGRRGYEGIFDERSVCRSSSPRGAGLRILVLLHRARDRVLAHLRRIRRPCLCRSHTRAGVWCRNRADEVVACGEYRTNGSSFATAEAIAWS
jgi:hypothetical protein